MFMQTIPIYVVYLSIVIPFSVQSAHAADISVISQVPISLTRIMNGECTILFKGPVEVHDSDKLRSLFELNKVEGYPNHVLDFQTQSDIRKHAFCLDSKGGDYSAALQFIRELISRRMITAIPENAECLSSCALIFLAGRLTASNSSGGAATPFRVMHVSSTLGFHSPYSFFVEKLNEVPKEGRVEAASIAYRTAISVVAELHDVLSQQRNSFEDGGGQLPTELLLEMLGKDSREEYYYVDTVDKAGAYNIRLSGAPEPEMGPAAFFTACSNLVSWNGGRTSDSYASDVVSWAYSLEEVANNARINFLDELEISAMDSEPLPPNKKIDEIAYFSVESRHEICDFVSSDNDDFPYYSYFRFNEDSRRVNERPLQKWFFYPRYVTLRQLEGLYNDKSGNRFETRYGRSDGPFQGNAVIDQFSPGYSYVFRASYPFEYWAIYLGLDGLIKIYANENEAYEYQYTLDDNQLCIEDANIANYDGCYYLRNRTDDAGGVETIVWDGQDETIHNVVFARPGDVGPVPPVPER